MDTATSLGQGGDKGFFKSQAQTHIAYALEMLFELNRPVTLVGAYELLSNRALLEEEMENLAESARNTAPRSPFTPTFSTVFSPSRTNNLAASVKPSATTCNIF